MTRISLSKIHVNKLLLRYLRWKALALAAIVIGSLTVWQSGVAQSVSPWSLVKHLSSAAPNTFHHGQKYCQAVRERLRTA